MLHSSFRGASQITRIRDYCNVAALTKPQGCAICIAEVNIIHENTGLCNLLYYHDIKCQFLYDLMCDL